MSKFGILEERITGCVADFVPDGSNLGTVEAPEITGPTAKPADDADWEGYWLGRITQAAYDAVTNDRTRQWFSPQKKKYIQRADRQTLADAFNLTMIDYPKTLFDGMMFGLAGEVVLGESQPIFAKGERYRDGWIRLKRYNEVNKELVTHAEFHVRLTIQTAPEDSAEPGSPVWRIQHLGDATEALETIIIGEEE